MKMSPKRMKAHMKKMGNKHAAVDAEMGEKHSKAEEARETPKQASIEERLARYMKGVKKGGK